MPIEHCRAASRRKAPRPEQGHGPPTVKNRWRQALALGAVAALTGAQARLTPSPSAAPHPAAGGLPPKTGPYGYAQALVTPNHAPYFGTQAPAPAPTPAAPTPAPAPAWATPLAPDVIMQSFFAGLSRGMAQSGAHNAYYVSRSGFAGATFGLLFTDAPVACGATPLPTPSIQICSNFASHGGSIVAGDVVNADQSIFQASNVGFTNAPLDTSVESGSVHFTGDGGLPIAFNYSAQVCDTLPCYPPASRTGGKSAMLSPSLTTACM